MSSVRSEVLHYLSGLISQHKESILEANLLDVQELDHPDPALLDRLLVDEKKLSDMQRSLFQTASIEDPDGKTLYSFNREDGLFIQNKTVPFGTILIIYESRPDVTIEAAAMAFKSGNRILLKGGKESHRTNFSLVKLWQMALERFRMDTSLVRYLEMDRAGIQQLISDSTSEIDLIIPRGGDSLIQFVQKNSTVPVIISGRGNNFIYVHEDADEDMSVSLILNGKSRISVCNAIDKVLIHSKILQEGFISKLGYLLNQMGIQVFVHESMVGMMENAEIYTDEEIMGEEFLAPKVLLRPADDIESAVELINKWSGGHSACIVTEDSVAANEFMNRVDAAAVYHNASTRFTDGGQVGFGGEIAISTQKLHFRGPIGVDQLVTNKWFIKGNGHIRN